MISTLNINATAPIFTLDISAFAWIFTESMQRNSHQTYMNEVNRHSVQPGSIWGSHLRPAACGLNFTLSAVGVISGSEPGESLRGMHFPTAPAAAALSLT